jgi:hypothetical protein
MTSRWLSCLSLGLLAACSSGTSVPTPPPVSSGGDAGPTDVTSSSNSQPDTSSAPDGGDGVSAEPTSTWEEPTSTGPIPYEDGATAKSPLIINEVMASNDGAWIDAVGEAEDWVELVNTMTGSLHLEDYTLEDSKGEAVPLPAVTLRAGQRVILWLDEEVDQGSTHLPLKLSASGDELTLRNQAGEVLDTVEFTDAVTNESLLRMPDVVGEFVRCRYATPGTSNGDQCVPPVPPDIESSVTYAPYEFPEPFPAVGGPLVISELALNPASFIEILNVSSTAQALSNYALRSSTTGPGLAWPTQAQGTLIPLPDVSLAAGERVLVELDAEHVADIAADPAYEGVITLFDTRSLAAIERVDFMRWPEDAVLTRLPDEGGLFRFCTNETPGEANECDALPSRDVGDRIRHLYTPGDYEALANGETQLGIQGVKFVYDMKSGGVVHLLSTEKWALHYTFIREEIYGDPPLDRCDPDERREFDDGWYDFSVTEYFSQVGRSFLLGTLTEHSGTGLHTVEHAIGDEITGALMKEAFYAVIPHTDNPTQWALRPQDEIQAERAKSIEGELPIVSPEEPFQNVTFQPLTEGVAYGTLKFVTSDRLYEERLGPDVIVITDDVPNDIPLVGGLITEAFQTPLAHVNVLSENRGTPNAALRNARIVLAEHLDKLVRIEVNASGLHVGEADLEEAQEYWDSFVPAAANISPRIDETVRGVQPLSAHSLESIPSVGAKAAQLAELGRIDPIGGKCNNATLNLPEAPFAIPVVHSREHFEASGAKALLEELSAEDSFKEDPLARADALEQVRTLILDFPVSAALLTEVEQAVEERWGNERIRLRSSSNTEDLPNFTGAGLYTSIAAHLDEPGEIEDGIRTVWASLWNSRAYDERRFAGIDPTNIAMGVLVHPAYPSEEANGVAVTRNVLDLSRGDVYYFNVQAGEAAVTNPAPGVTTEQLTYNWGRTPLLMYQSESSLLEALDPVPTQVLSTAEASELACSMSAIHDWFRPLLDPDNENPHFTMESEFKLIGPERTLLIKQARPHSFGSQQAIGDCREL